MSSDPVLRDWGLRLEGVDIPKRTMDALVLGWLVNQGHCEAAQTFARECGTGPDAIDANGITERVAIRQAVESGDIHTAIDAAQKLDSTVQLRMTACPRPFPALHELSFTSPCAQLCRLNPNLAPILSRALFLAACRSSRPTRGCCSASTGSS
jgi:hypothetical protein